MAYQIMDFINLKNFDPSMGINPDSFYIVKSAVYPRYSNCCTKFQFMDGVQYSVMAYRANQLQNEIRVTINGGTYIQHIPDLFDLFSFDCRIITRQRQTIDYYFYYDSQTQTYQQSISNSQVFDINNPMKLSMYILLSSDPNLYKVFETIGYNTYRDATISSLPPQYQNKILSIQYKLRIKKSNDSNAIYIRMNNVDYGSGTQTLGVKQVFLTDQITEMDTHGYIIQFLQKIYPNISITQ